MSSENFADRLVAEMKKLKSRVIVGLDPIWEHLPVTLKEDAMSQFSMASEGPGSHMWAVREFCDKIIAATKDVAVAYKAQIAFFERYGYTGLRVLERLLKDHEDKLIIVDCKRGDICSTSEAYAKCYFHHKDEPRAPMPCDAVTHNAYLGKDSVEPYFEYLREDKGMFILSKTSNPGAEDFQELQVDGKPFYEHVATKVGEWGEEFVGESGYSSMGLVVGATYPEAAERVRKAAPKAMLLVPGIGFQGGSPQHAEAFCDKNGCGAVFNFSRSVIYAYKFGQFKDKYEGKDYQTAARVAAEHYCASLNDVLGTPE